MTSGQTFTINAFATTNKQGEFKPVQSKVYPLKDYEVYVKIEACGVCHTDLNYSSVPGLILGHEPVGTIEAVGPAVTKYVLGDTVGTAYLKWSCNECDLCHSGEDVLCRRRVFFPEGNNNGFASGAIWDSRYIFKIPKGIEPKHAGPLMCAGSTVFSALYGNKVLPTSRVAIIGIGGLGHLGLQFARAWGCHVVAISTSKNKEKEALKFGAHEFWSSKDFTPEFIEKAEKFDVIINTVSTDIDYNTYIDLLGPAGNLCLIGIPPGSFKFDKVLPFLADEKKITGKVVGGRHTNNKMLEFAARHNIRPQIEEYPMSADGIAKAFNALHHNAARYRAVLIPTEKAGDMQ